MLRFTFAYLAIPSVELRCLHNALASFLFYCFRNSNFQAGFESNIQSTKQSTFVGIPVQLQAVLALALAERALLRNLSSGTAVSSKGADKVTLLNGIPVLVIHNNNRVRLSTLSNPKHYLVLVVAAVLEVRTSYLVRILTI